MSIKPTALASAPLPRALTGISAPPAADTAAVAAPSETGPHKLTLTDRAVGVGIPTVLGGLGAYATMRAARQAVEGIAKSGRIGDAAKIMLGSDKAVRAGQIAGKKWVAAVISTGMAGYMAWQAVNRLHKVDSITNPPDTHRTRQQSVTDGAIAGAVALGGATAAIMALRGGGGGGLANGVGRSFGEATKQALKWVVPVAVVGAAGGALAGATLREPEAAIRGVRDQAVRTGLHTGITSGALAGVAAGGITFWLGHGNMKTTASLVKHAAAAALGTAGIAGVYMGVTSMSSSATNHYAAAWANSPKR